MFYNNERKIKMRIREKERQIEQLNEIKAQNCVLFEESIKQFKDYQQRIQNLNNEIKSKDISSVDENYLDIELENKIKDIIGKVDEKFKQSKNPAEEKDQIVNQLKKDPKNESIVAVFEAVDESSTQLIENINELQEKLFRSHSIDYDARFEILQSKDREVKNSDLTNEEIKVEPSQFQSEGNALKSIIEHKDQEIQELMKTNAQLVKTIEILKKQISGKIEPTSNERILDLEQRLTNEIKENELLKAENNQLSEANKKYKAELRKMSIEQSQLNAANNNEIMEFTEQIFDLKQRLERKQQKKKILKFKINQLSEDIKNSKAELIKVSNENRELIKIISASNNEFKKSNEDKLNLSLNSITTSTLEQLSNQKMSLGGKIKLFLFT
ncbi:hypothetical protein TVAG_249030 [Trichomonas vaginalis G3]|uniref:Uncharacterized protein n=1 Tax=Trichomonas vaginalis (strain ATCC PRA-98 / G3) TaxID=412133 RepID=A2DCA6_TRIV3|nr:hypothetical protein TVAGG3_0957850 [Trichomonas vaginalis G3]EAY21843.1 hypothetical protein TVAG_249030 [Trichomonas vaginalis G3]KAI5487687.1 hypothetical protein TVAGG3_0957850 [Trichomonas vaginalis G3]|eukprot:XP_001582829.1 hypothetical protein [Trichomonas vaginalis G3]